MGGKDLLGNKGLQERLAGRNLCGIKDSILDAFASRDFAQVMRLADLLDLQESSASDFGKSFDKDSSEDSSGNCGKNCGEDFGCDFGEDFIVAGAKELGEFTSSAIAISALEVAKATQAIGKITKQAVIFAKIAQKAHKDSQDKIPQDKSTQNEQDKSTQNILCDWIIQDKMAFYDLTLAKAYASNGNIEESKEILQNLAKPFLDFALQNRQCSAKSNAMDSSFADFGFVDCAWIKSHIDENIGGGGGDDTLAQNPSKNPAQNLPKTPSQNPAQNPPKNIDESPATNPIPSLNTNIAKEILCALAELHTALGELEKAEKIYKAILHSKWCLSEQDLQDMFDANGNLNPSAIRAIESLWRLYEKSSEQKCLEIFYEILRTLEGILANLKSTNEQIPYTSPNDSLPDMCQPLQERLTPLPRTIGQNDKQIKHLQGYINCMILPGIAFYLYCLYRDKESLNLYSELERFNQANSDFWSFYADTLWHSGAYQQAYDAFQKSISLRKNASALFSCGKMLLQLLESEEIYKEGLALYEHRLALLNETAKGKWALSLSHYEACRQDLARDKNALYGKVVFVYAEQGYGDTIMFSPALAKLCAMAKKVLFFPQSLLFRLFDTSLEMLKNNGNKDFENLHIIGSLPRDKNHKNSEVNPKLTAYQKESARLSGYEFDYAVPICSLPFLMDMSLQEWQSLPKPIVPISRKDSSAKSSAKKIALFWHTNSSGNFERFKRDIPLEILECAFRDSPHEIISFQVREVINGKKEDFIIPSFMQNRGENLLDWQDTYEALSDIDMIVSIDSALAHLGLALGIPTLVLLPIRFDWRWGRLESPKSPFYPHAHLLVWDSNQNDEKMLKRNKSTIQNIRKICDKVLQ
ncbi:glycosyltransferase family protein [Helicobacter macacae]|uniref:Uncharacterized protein n=1 Tax=Helicobacter macacae MIT 99-5501 TaxID=1357400 RepID=V8CAH0_9HELI|nr:hypothetical protein [Helicobacter macacae]ETD24082.1 hypothetical protein HMPREF2086_00829 [Helicobacter macacae MIT 99-5501]